LLLTITNALSHNLYYKMIDPNTSTAHRVTISKMLLLVVTLAAAYVAAQKPADILFLVSAAFSFAAAAFFPALVLGIFWKRATGVAAALGMIAGLGITFYYMATTATPTCTTADPCPPTAWAGVFGRWLDIC
jgi:cation/acetate symporter